MNLKKIYIQNKVLVIVLSLLSIILLYSISYIIYDFYIKSTMEFKGNKTLGHYTLLATKSESPFVVDLFENETNKKYIDVEISDNCPEYSSIKVNQNFTLFKYTHFKIKDQSESNSFEGLYEAACLKNKKLIPN